MDKEHLETTQALIKSYFEIEETEQAFTEEDLLRHLSNRIAYMIEYELELLLSTMYRLDVAEDKVQMSLSPLSTEAPNVALAKIVLERQKQRAHTKLTYKPEDLGPEWEF